jgi:ABC-type sugar transport system ATPase subunit
MKDTMQARSNVALSAAGLSKRFGATTALDDASLDLAVGEVHALLGENGSGKSTLAKILAGIYRSDSGTIERGGQRVDIADPASARSLGIGIVLQELSLAPDLSVVDNLFFGAGDSFSWMARSEI